jgi:hypothetical protein
MVTLSALQSAVMQLYGSASQGGFDFSVLAPSSQGASFNGGSVKAALEQADKNEARQLAQIAKSPLNQKDLARYSKVVKSATTLNEVLDDPVARRVFLKAHGLGSQVDAVALAKKALASDPTDEESLAHRLGAVNGAWLDTAIKYNFPLFGLTELKTSESIKEVSDNYVAELRLDQLDQQMPGLGSAVLFKRIAANLDTPIKVLGSALGREVVTTALGLPKQLALQSLQAQEKAIVQRLDVKKLKNPDFVDKLAQRYLIQLNGGAGGITV